MRIIYGQDTTYGKALEEAKIPKLSERRIELVRKFAIGCFNNPRYNHWFPKAPPIPHQLRRLKQLKEDRPKTERKKKCPVYQMVKIINEL